MPTAARALAVDLDVVDEQRRLRRGAEPLERDLVDPRLGLPASHERRVDDHVEDLVDREHRAPVRLPLADVVGADRHLVAAAAQLAHVIDHPLVRLEVLEVARAEPVERDRAAARARTAHPRAPQRMRPRSSARSRARTADWTPSARRSSPSPCRAPRVRCRRPASAPTNDSSSGEVSTPPKSLMTARFGHRRPGQDVHPGAVAPAAVPAERLGSEVEPARRGLRAFARGLAGGAPRELLPVLAFAGEPQLEAGADGPPAGLVGGRQARVLDRRRARPGRAPSR